MTGTIYVQTRVGLYVTFRNRDGALADPTTVVCKVLSPAGATTTPTVTQDGTGLYHTEVTLTEEGTWSYRFEGTGTVVAAFEENIRVADSAFY